MGHTRSTMPEHLRNQVDAALAKLPRPAPDHIGASTQLIDQGKRGNKYGVSPKELRTYNGVVYHSKAEMRDATWLDVLRAAGMVRWWLRQVRVPLGDDALVIDFLVCDNNGTVYAYERKGYETSVWKRKKKLWRKYGPFDLRVVYRTVTEVIQGAKL